MLDVGDRFPVEKLSVTPEGPAVVYRDRRDVNAIVHTHAPSITTLSVLRKPLPPVIDEVPAGRLYKDGSLLVSDDYAGAIYRISYDGRGLAGG